MKWNGLQVERVRFLAVYRSLFFVALRLVAFVILIVSLVVLGLSLLGITDSTLLGLTLILLGPALAVCSFHLYALDLDSAPPAGGKSKAVLDRFDLESVRALLRYKQTGSRLELWRVLAHTPLVETALYRLGLSIDRLAQLYPGRTDDADQLVAELLEHNGDRPLDLFEVFRVALGEAAIRTYLQQIKLDATDVSVMVDHYADLYRSVRGERFWTAWKERTGGFAKLWSVSYTTLLDRFTEEIGPGIARRQKLSPLVARDETVHRLILELNKKAGQNVLLVGPAGVGKTEVFYELAARITGYRTDTPLDGMQVRVLDTASLLSAASTPEELTPLFHALFADLSRAGNVVLLIPKIELLLGDSGSGSANAVNLLGQHLGDNRVHIVGTISPEAQVTLVRSQAALAENFSSVTVPAPTGPDLARILLAQLPAIEYRSGVFFFLNAVTTLTALAGRYLKDESSPQREIRLAEEVAAQSQGQSRLITTEDVVSVVERRASVRLQVDEAEQDTLLNLESELHRRVIGQDRAIKLVSDALLRARAGLHRATKPIGTFLFLGPTGVGKTETAKALSEIYFGSTGNLIRLDMSEYADANGLEKLLGTDAVQQPGALTVAIQKTPSAVILFDEIEKASEMVRNVMLQLLDEGRLTTNFGKVLDFTNSIVIATSNAGSDFIKAQVEKKTAPQTLEGQLLDRLIAERVFAPEYLNRFDGVVVYLPLTIPEIKQIVALQLEQLKVAVAQEKGVTLQVSDAVAVELAKRGYDPVFGARALQRVLKSDLETAIARQLIAERPQPGSTLVIDSL